MPDIALRFNRDMLVLSAPLDAALARQGIDAASDRQYLNLMEPDQIRDALRFEELAGAHCLVTTTEDITQARLAHVRMDGDATKLAHAAVAIANELSPQHVLAEIGPCGLPLDRSSKASLNESRAQYAQAAHAFDGEQIDAFFLNGFSDIDDLRCAIMGVSQASAKPVFASVVLRDDDTPEDAAGAQGAPASAAPPSAQEESQTGVGGPSLFANYTYVEPPTFTGVRRPTASLPASRWPEAIALMEDMGVAVVGFETAEPPSRAVKYAKQAAELTGLPLLAQLRVKAQPDKRPGAALVPLDEIDEYTPDTMASIAVKLYGAGVQFLRATGDATPAYTGALAATVFGLDVRAR